MKRNLLLLMLFTIVSPLFGLTLKLSLEDCIAMAEQESLDKLFAQIEEERLDIKNATNWRIFLPEAGYRLETTGQETEYIYHGEGDPPSPIDYYYNNQWNYLNIDDDTVTKQQYLKHDAFIRQRLFDSHWLKTFEDIKSTRLRKEILTTLFKGRVRYDVRTAYYRCLIYQEGSRKCEEVLKEFITGVPLNNSLGLLMEVEQKSVLLDIKGGILSYNRLIDNYKKTLLTILQKPMDSKLELTTPLKTITFNMETARKTALENNLSLKKLAIQRMMNKTDLSQDMFAYFPALNFTFNTPLADKLTGNITAKIDPGSSSFYVDMEAKYILDDRYVEWDTLGGSTISDITEDMLWTREDKTKFSLRLTYSLSDLLNANDRRRIDKMNLKSTDIQIKKEIAKTLYDLEEFVNNHEYNVRSLELDNERLALFLNKKNLLEQAAASNNGEFLLSHYITTLGNIRNLTVPITNIMARYDNYIRFLLYIEGLGNTPNTYLTLFDHFNQYNYKDNYLYYY
ncbi:MAG: hypothetical protein JXJ04_13455 [Spirochaetales bacterium]|nr:hypothetical protein [Spirochaetales bacterium]